MSPDTDNLRSDQSVLPLAGVALCLLALGFLLAFRSADNGAQGQPSAEEVTLPDEVAGEATASDAPVKLGYGSISSTESDEPRSDEYSLRLGQTKEARGGAEVTSKINLEGKNLYRPRADQKKGIELERRYHTAKVSVADASTGESAPEIVRQVARMLEGSRLRIRMTPVGVRDQVDWTSVTNPQVRRALGLVRAADQLLMPRFRDGPVNSGESWTYRYPVPSKRAYEETHPDLEVDGSVTVKARFAGVVRREGRRLAVIVRRVSFQATGRGGKEKKAPSFSMSGSGRGEALFDMKRRRVVDSWLRVHRSASIDQQRYTGGGDAEIKVRLKQSD